MSSPVARPTVGESAPEIELTDANGETWRLSDQRGHAVLLIFHRHSH